MVSGGQLADILQGTEGGPSPVSGEGVFPIQHHEADGCLMVIQRFCLGFKRGLVLILDVHTCTCVSGHAATCTKGLASHPHTHDTYTGTEAHVIASWAWAKGAEKLGALPHLPDLPLPVLSDRVSLQRGGAVHAQGGPHEGHAHEAVGGGHSRGHPDSNR